MAKKILKMSNEQKQKYAELFTVALDTMECENYTKPWISPNHGDPCNYKYKRAYKGMNNFILTLLCCIKGWETPYFLTFDQLTQMGLSLNVMMKDGMAVIKGNGMPAFERSFPVVKSLPNIFRNGERITLQDYDELTDEEKEECRKYFSLKPYAEFNLSQTNFKELFPERWESLTKVQKHEYKAGNTDFVLELMIMGGQWRCPIEFGGYEASYSPSKDRIRLPERSSFLGDEKFLQTALHEMAHSTAPELGRNVENGFGSEAYAMEEFIAELTAACVCSMLGIGKLLDENHIAYVANWRQALHDDKEFIPKVINSVQYATNYILRKYDAIAKKLRGPLALPLAA